MGIRIAVGTVDFIEVNAGEDGVDSNRAIVDAYRYRAASGGTQKVLVVRYPSTLSEGAQNALQKTLENLRDGDHPGLHVILYCADVKRLPDRFASLVER